ncbi:MAG: hypothetical protein IIT65_15390, partial [Lachnospiraceae bacterium]|nr:hypothetical protein [Lachnospiraceae bacterium]
MTSIEKSAFANCKNLEKVTSMLAKPFAISDETFDSDTYSNATLYVPKGTVAQYKATDGWKNFKNIVEDSTTAINDVEADNTLNTANVIYDTNGKRLSATSLDELPSGLYIINGKKVVKQSTARRQQDPGAQFQLVALGAGDGKGLPQAAEILKL